MRIGLYGGTFNPPHAGHRLVALRALTALGLDRLWWLVTPGNPLKSNSRLPSMAERVAAIRALVRHPRVTISGIEQQIGTRFTVDTLRFLVRRAPGVHFVWVMGGDSLATFHRWKDWRSIATLMPMAVVDRPGTTLRAGLGKAGLVLGRFRQASPTRLARRQPPAWVLLYGRRMDLSSTQLRRQSLAQ